MPWRAGHPRSSARRGPAPGRGADHLPGDQEKEGFMRNLQYDQRLRQMITAYWTSRAIYVAAKLRVADRLAHGARSAEDLAAEAGVASQPLYRVLRALTSLGIFAGEADGRFRLNPPAELLRQ